MTRHMFPGRFKLQWALLVSAWVALAGVLTYTQLTLRDAIVSDEHARLLTLTRVASQMLTVQVESADAAVRTMRDSLDRWRAGDGFAPFAMDHLKRVERMMPGVRTFLVMDAHGRCQLSNRIELVGQTFAERDYFKAVVASAAQGKDVLNVSAPFRTVLGAWAVNVSRAVIDDTGAFAGLVVATLSPEYFRNLMADMAHAPDMRLALAFETGRLYVSVPAVDDADNVDFMQKGSFARQHRDSGAAESVLSGDTLFPGGGQRVAAVKTVSLVHLGAEHVFYAGASRSVDAVLADWYRESFYMLVSVAALVAVSAFSL
ncbi:MAG: PDC sensor domain-containing protein, partial [Burkholderiaceae bacterium]